MLSFQKIDVACCCHLQGKGTKLGEMPNGEHAFCSMHHKHNLLALRHDNDVGAAVAFHLGKTTGRDELLEDLHQILYGRKGKV